MYVRNFLSAQICSRGCILKTQYVFAKSSMKGEKKKSDGNSNRNQNKQSKLPQNIIPIRGRRRKQEVANAQSKPLQVRGEEAQPHNAGDGQTVGLKRHCLRINRRIHTQSHTHTSNTHSMLIQKTNTQLISAVLSYHSKPQHMFTMKLMKQE